MKVPGVALTDSLKLALHAMLAGFLRFLSFLSFLFLGSLLFADEPKAKDLIEIKLITDSSKISPNSEVWVGFQVSLSPGWHIYWKNSGQSGYPTSVSWLFDHPDWKEESLQFPQPYLYEYEGMVGYALKNQFTLLVQLVAPSKLKKVAELKGKFDALICNESTCLPYEFSFSLNFPLSEKQEYIDEHVVFINDARNKLPELLPTDIHAKAIFNAGKGKLIINGEQLSKLSGDKFNFFPINPLVEIKHNGKFFHHKENALLIDWQYSGTEEDIPNTIEGILTHPKILNGWKVSVPLGSEQSTQMLPSISSSNKTKIEDEFLLLNILLGLVVIAMAAWAWGRSHQPQSLTKNWQIFAIISLCLGLWLGYPKQQPTVSDDKLKWSVWSQKLQDQLLAEGEAVYIDYTAKWCLSCQVNKRVYNNETVIGSLLDKKVHLLRADWTKKSPNILKSLQSHGREGVPLYVFYPARNKGVSSNPQYLPEILSSESIVNLVNDDQNSIGLLNQKTSYIALLGLAWLGGLILNLMPCVFPVLGLKIMGFVKQAGEEHEQIKHHGWIFTLGVLISFWVVVGILLLLREGFEQQLGWGFQLQNPTFVLCLAVFLFLFGLSLSGVFEIGMSLSGLGAGLSRKSGLWGSFFSGVLATVVATPCMAPFLGVAVGAALAMPVLPSIAIFTSIAIGLSTPYLLLSFFPSWLHKLPKPGLWMDSFKQFMAFPIYATVAWLVWTLNGILQ